eukprot:gene10138-2303_t
MGITLSVVSARIMNQFSSFACSDSFRDKNRNNATSKVFAGVEGGGTTWRAAIAVGSATNIVERETFDTEVPEKTLTAIRAWLDERSFDALGIASFGPIEPNPDHHKYGFITSTPKQFWKVAQLTDTPVVSALWNGKVPHKFDTDVNAPALAEYKVYGKTKGHTTCAYITVGTGVGVGIVVNGKPVHGLLHPEGGHIRLGRHPKDTFRGTCPFHGDCVEGLVASGALAQRLGVDPKALKGVEDNNIVWDLVAHTLASLCVSLILTLSPERIVISGGIMQRPCLLPFIHKYTLELLNGYIAKVTTMDDVRHIISRSTWDNDAGIIGSLTLAQVALEEAAL